MFNAKQKHMGKLTMRNLKFHEDMSEETPCFSADLYEDGKLVAHVKNSGKGGCCDLDLAKGLTWKDVQHLTTIDKDCEIMGLAEEMNAVQKSQSKALVLKKGDSLYRQKYKHSFAQMKKAHPTQFPQWIKREIDKVKADGYEVLNTNLGL
jgi:cell division FtsZ-interacting protein ZapD